MILSVDDDPELFEAMSTDGMLSAGVEVYRQTFLEVWARWFTFCRDLNTITLKVWMDHWRDGEGGSSAALKPTASRILARAMNAFCAAVVLCERGASIEAAGLARTIAEASFWLAYLTEAPEAALSDLEADDLKNFIERERELRRVHPDQAELIAASNAREEDYKIKLGDRAKPSIAKIAQAHGVRDGYLRYRILSGFYGHLSQASLRHNFLPTGAKAGVNILGPHGPEIGKALHFAAASLIDCGAAYAVIAGDESAALVFAEAGVSMAELGAPLLDEPGA